MSSLPQGRTNTVALSNVSFKGFSLVSGYAGYAEHIPVLGQGYTGKLPCRGDYHGRIVSLEIEEDEPPHLLEIWSINSRLCPIAPGKKDPDFDAIHATLGTLRVDGHTGIFDPLENPQNFSPRFPWLPLLESGPQEGESRCVWVDFTDHLLVDREGPDALVGVDDHLICALLDENFALWLRMSDLATTAAANSPLWDNRPTFPQPVDILNLREFTTYPTRLYSFTQIQRGMRLKKAWLRYTKAESVARRGDMSIAIPATFPPADDSLMGVFVEGMSESDLLWYSVVARAPVFFVSCLSDPEESQLSSTLLYAPWELSIALWRQASSAPYGAFFESRGGTVVSEVKSGRSLDPSYVQRYGLDRNSSRQRGYFASIGVITDEDGTLAYARHRAEDVWDSLFMERYERYSPSPLRTIDMGRNHLRCIIPPKPPPGVGVYDYFYMTPDLSRPDEDFPFCFIHGTALDSRFIGNPHPNSYFDYEHGRVVVLTHPGSVYLPAGYIADATQYGFPAPPWRMYSYDNGGLYLLRYSNWLYASAVPSRAPIAAYPLPRPRSTPAHSHRPERLETVFVEDLEESACQLLEIMGPEEDPIPSSSSVPPIAEPAPPTRTQTRRSRRARVIVEAKELQKDWSVMSGRMDRFFNHVLEGAPSEAPEPSSSSLEERLSDVPYSHGKAL
ncbi:hypothetical protein BDZ89DRAFT_1054633 [Hymenopellis radicata]|nr:hypothetical protein BDZ89DRAFT_1054633 [Hymenopellis radicata]